MGYRLVSKLVSLNGIIALICIISPNLIDYEADYVTSGSVQNMLFQLYCGRNWPMQQSHGLFATAELLAMLYVCSHQ